MPAAVAPTPPDSRHPAESARPTAPTKPPESDDPPDSPGTSRTQRPPRKPTPSGGSRRKAPPGIRRKPPENKGFPSRVCYYAYRWYNTYMGSWPSRDPIGEEGGVNLYGFVGNDGVNFIDVFGFQSWTPYPGTGLMLSGDHSDSNVEDADTKRCIQDKKNQNAMIAAKIVALSESGLNGADCEEYDSSGASTGCTKISIIIAIPHPCKPPAGIRGKDNGNPGHVAIGVGDEILDFGPSGRHWMRLWPTMDELNKGIPRKFNKKNNVIIYEYCVCKNDADLIRDTMIESLDDKYDARSPYRQCAAAACIATRFGVQPWYTPLEFQEDLFLKLPVNQCGRNKMAFGNLRWMAALGEESHINDAPAYFWPIHK